MQVQRSSLVVVLTLTKGAPLPSGWEMRHDPNGRPYFVDHNRKITT